MTEPFGLFNEALACTLLSGLGVPCSEGAVLPAPVLGSDEATLAFASLEAARGFEGTAKQIYQPLGPEQLDEVTRRLHACAAFASIIAADQLLGNSDRNIGNLAFTGPRSIEIFDHEAILGGAAFPTERLYEPQVWARSKLIEDLAPIQALSPRLKTGIIAAAEVLVDLFYEIQPEFSKAIQVGATGRATASAEAIRRRSHEVVGWFRSRLGLLI